MKVRRAIPAPRRGIAHSCSSRLGAAIWRTDPVCCLNPRIGIDLPQEKVTVTSGIVTERSGLKTHLPCPSANRVKLFSPCLAQKPQPSLGSPEPMYSPTSQAFPTEACLPWTYSRSTSRQPLLPCPPPPGNKRVKDVLDPALEQPGGQKTVFHIYKGPRVTFMLCCGGPI